MRYVYWFFSAYFVILFALTFIGTVYPSYWIIGLIVAVWLIPIYVVIGLLVLVFFEGLWRR